MQTTGSFWGEARVVSSKVVSLWIQGGCYYLSPSRSDPPSTSVPAEPGRGPAGIPKAATTLTSRTWTASWCEKLPGHSQCICLKTGENLVFALSKRFQS